MLYRTYGSTGIDVSAIGFGGMRFRDQNNVEECASLVKTAYDAGITYFDTAPGYGESEVLFGEAFKEMKKTRAEKPFYVSTKSNKADPAAVRADCEASLERMGIDQIDFYHVWYVLSLDEYKKRKANGVLREFEKLKEEGLVRNIVVSTHMPGSEVGEMLRDYPFEGVLLGYSVMNFAYREQALADAAALGRGVVVMNPLGGGIIPQHPELFDFVRTREDETAVQGALRFLLNDPRITVALVGFSTPEHVREAVDAASGFEPLSDDTVAGIRGKLQESFNELCTACRYCDKCPHGVPVPELMDSYNHFKLTGDANGLMGRLRWHWGLKPEDEYYKRCVECGLCEDACTQHLDICRRLKVIRGEVEKHLANQQ